LFCVKNPILIEYKPSASERMLIYRMPLKRIIGGLTMTLRKKTIVDSQINP